MGSADRPPIKVCHATKRRSICGIRSRAGSGVGALLIDVHRDCILRASVRRHRSHLERSSRHGMTRIGLRPLIYAYHLRPVVSRSGVPAHDRSPDPGRRCVCYAAYGREPRPRGGHQTLLIAKQDAVTEPPGCLRPAIGPMVETARHEAPTQTDDPSRPPAPLVRHRVDRAGRPRQAIYRHLRLACDFIFGMLRHSTARSYPASSFAANTMAGPTSTRHTNIGAPSSVGDRSLPDGPRVRRDRSPGLPTGSPSPPSQRIGIRPWPGRIARSTPSGRPS
jgi:hypothetical protein